MIYSLSLQTVGWIVGLLLVIGHALALMHAEGARQLLPKFPRAYRLGVALLVIGAIWAFFIVNGMDLGEFTKWRKMILMAIIAGTGLTAMYVEEFLSVRALGVLLLLGAEPLLEAAFLRGETSRYLLVLLGYGWATLGLFLVGMPYLLRDAINWIVRSKARWQTAAVGGILYGAAILFFAATQWS